MVYIKTYKKKTKSTNTDFSNLVDFIILHNAEYKNQEFLTKQIKTFAYSKENL